MNIIYKEGDWGIHQNSDKSIDIIHFHKNDLPYGTSVFDRSECGGCEKLIPKDLLALYTIYRLPNVISTSS